MELRDYQQRMVEAIRARWAAGQKRVLGVLPTGGGKTETAIDIIRTEATPTDRALVIVDRKVLCSQWADRMRRHCVDYVGILQGNNTRATAAPVLVGTAQTIRRRGVPEGVGLVVIDESHIWHETHDQVLDAVGATRVLGLSATPLRAGLGLRFDTVVVGATIRDLIARNMLVGARYFAPKQAAIDEALAGVSIRAGDFASNELSCAMSGKTIVGDVVATWQQRGEDRPTIAFCVDKAHAALLAEEFTRAGIPAACVIDETTDEERQQAFADFNAGALRVLCSVGVLSIGFDSPIASCAILARPTMSLSLYVQQGGRVLRPYPGKADALILDHAGNSLRHGLLEEFEPPTSLSEIEETADKVKRTDPPQAWVCKHCECVNAIGDDFCVGCGEPRRKHTSVVVIDGELVNVKHNPGEELPGPTLDDIRTGYQMLMHHAESRGLKPGWAFYAAIRRYRIPEHRAKALIDYHWRYLPHIPPDEACARWLRADWQRQKIVQKYSQRRADTCAA